MLPLNSTTISRLQASTTVSSFSSAIQLLLSNSVHAKATFVRIDVDLSTLSVVITDDSCLEQRDLEFDSSGEISHRRLHTPNEFPTLRSYSLHSLMVVGTLSVVSNSPLGTLSYGEGLNFSHKGTMVSVSNMFATIPVRRRHYLSMAAHRHLENIKLAMLNVLVGSLDTHVVLVCGETVIDICPKSYQEILGGLFGINIPYESFEASYKGLFLEGVVGTELFGPKPHQYVFLNGAPYSADLRNINRLFGEVFTSKREYPVYLFNIRETASNSDVFFLIKSTISGFLQSRGYEVSKRQKGISRAKETPSELLRLFRGNIQQGSYFIVGQLDKKFILLNSNGKLFVLDQHACDERVRVEALLKDYAFSVIGKNAALRMVEPISFAIDSIEAKRFSVYSRTFAYYGICYCVQDNRLQISHLPRALIELDAGRLREELLQHVHDLENSLKLPKTNFSADNWHSMAVHVPRCILNVFNSQACRAAVKFGDALSRVKMDQIVRELGGCKMPFVCAHGRPSMVPLHSSLAQ